MKAVFIFHKCIVFQNNDGVYGKYRRFFVYFRNFRAFVFLEN